MPIITCPHCSARKRAPSDKKGASGKYGRCDQWLPVFSLHSFFEGFSSLIEQFHDLLVLTDFYSPSCRRCQMFAPAVAALPKKFMGKIAIGKSNTTQNPQVAGKFHVRSVPTLLFFKNKMIIDQVVGAILEFALIQRIQNLL